MLHSAIISNLLPILSSKPTINNGEIYDELQTKVCWMQMRGGSKLRNFINPCTNSIKTNGFVIISGSGPAVTKVLNMQSIVNL